MASPKRFLSDSCILDLPRESPYAYDSGDEDLSLSDDESIPALSDIDSDSDNDDTTNFSMGSGSDLRSDISLMETNQAGIIISNDQTRWSTSPIPFENIYFPAISHGIPSECNSFTSAIGLLNCFTESLCCLKNI